MFNKLVALNKLRTAIIYDEVSPEYYNSWIEKYGKYLTRDEKGELQKLYNEH